MYFPRGNSSVNSKDGFDPKEKNLMSLPHPGLSKRVVGRYSLLKRELQLDSYQLRKRRTRRPTPNLSTMSAIANTDVLPSFRAAHGLLHPHTVMKLQEQHETEDFRSDAVTYFLDTYDQYGPMACLPCLTDPQVLPDLTKAMRKINL